jgi:hypothetical protein
MRPGSIVREEAFEIFRREFLSSFEARRIGPTEEDRIIVEMMEVLAEHATERRLLSHIHDVEFLVLLERDPPRAPDRVGVILRNLLLADRLSAVAAVVPAQGTGGMESETGSQVAGILDHLGGRVLRVDRKHPNDRVDGFHVQPYVPLRIGHAPPFELSVPYGHGGLTMVFFT